MVVCKYFMEGYCKFGVRCKFDHVDPYRNYDSTRSSDYSSERPQGTSIMKAASSSFGRSEYPHPPQHGFVQPLQGFGQNSFQSPQGSLMLTPQNAFGQTPQRSLMQTPQNAFGQSPQTSLMQTPQNAFGQTPQNSFNQTPQHGFSTPPQQGSFVQKPSGFKCNVQEIMQIVLRDIAQMEKGGQWQLSCYSPIKELPNMPGFEDYSPEELRWECYKALQNGSLPLCQVIVQQLFQNVAKINNELKRKDTGYSIIDRWLRDSEQQTAQNTTERPASAFTSPFGASSATPSAFSSPFFTSNEPQSQQSPQPQPPQLQPQPAASSFSFSLPHQQQPSRAQPFQQNSSLFSSNQTTSAFAGHSASPFSSPVQNTVVNDRVYSTIDALTEAELKAFQAHKFALGFIPTKPPPRELCNIIN